MAATNTALIGHGRWGRILDRYISGNGHFKLKYVCDSKTDLNTVWHDSTVKSVFIATPNDTHFQLTKMALGSGKHVFVEKPLSYSAYECEIVKEIARSSNLAVVTDYTFMFSKGIRKLVQCVMNGNIGKIIQIEMIFIRMKPDGNPFWRLGSHMLAVLDMMQPVADNNFRIVGNSIKFINGYINVALDSNVVRKTVINVGGSNGGIYYDPDSKSTISLRSIVAEKEYRYDERNNLKYAIDFFYNAMKGKAVDNLDTSIEVTRVLEKCQK